MNKLVMVTIFISSLLVANAAQCNVPQKLSAGTSTSTKLPGHDDEATTPFQDLFPSNVTGHLQCKSELQATQTEINRLKMKLESLNIILDKISNKQREIFEGAKSGIIDFDKDIMYTLFSLVRQFISINEPDNALLAAKFGLQLEPSNIRLLKMKFKLEKQTDINSKPIQTLYRNFGYF